MDVRAAVAFEAGKPLAVTHVQLEGPRAGEVLVEIKATGICHTDEFPRSGKDPEGTVPGDPRPRRRGRGGRAAAERHVGGGGSAAKVVGERHQCAAVQHAVPIGEQIGDQKLSRHSLGRDMGDLHAHEVGKRRLLVRIHHVVARSGFVVHASRIAII